VHPLFVVRCCCRLRKMFITARTISLVMLPTSRQILVSNSLTSCSLSENTFYFKYRHTKKYGTVKFGDSAGHETSADLEIRRPGDNLQQCSTNRGAHLMDIIFLKTSFCYCCYCCNGVFDLFKQTLCFTFIYHSNKYTTKIRCFIFNKAVPTCFRACAPF
jgi:hypothetical protein